PRAAAAPTRGSRHCRETSVILNLGHSAAQTWLPLRCGLVRHYRPPRTTVAQKRSARNNARGTGRKTKLKALFLAAVGLELRQVAPHVRDVLLVPARREH